jgi:hypothetical protein
MTESKQSGNEWMGQGGCGKCVCTSRSRLQGTISQAREEASSFPIEVLV